MKMLKSKLLSSLFLCLGVVCLNAQTSCEDLLAYVKSESYGSTYYSYDSDAISKVTFYSVTDSNYNRYYFAVVQFTSSYKEYIYQVGSNTKLSYSLDYYDSAGKAFWEHIEPYSDVLGCSPRF